MQVRRFKFNGASVAVKMLSEDGEELRFIMTVDGHTTFMGPLKEWQAFRKGMQVGFEHAYLSKPWINEG